MAIPPFQVRIATKGARCTVYKRLRGSCELVHWYTGWGCLLRPASLTAAPEGIHRHAAIAKIQAMHGVAWQHLNATLQRGLLPRRPGVHIEVPAQPTAKSPF